MKPQIPNFNMRILIPAIIAAASFQLEAAPAAVSFDCAKVETYKVASDDELKLYIFNPDDHRPGKDKRPAIMFFFGGGWNGGTPGQFEQHCRYLAARGMVAITADYRVKSRQNTSPKECVADGKSAVRYIRQNANRLGIDPKWIAAGGGSAGGHVAATTGFVDGFEDPKDAQSISSKANALVLFNPVYDNGPGGYGHDRVKDYWEKFSPAHNITKDDSPAVVFLGTKDSLIPVKTAEKFRDDMREAGIKSELHLYEGQAHGFFNESKGGTEIFLDTIRKMDQFLVEAGFLKGKPTEQQVKAVSRPSTKKKKKKK